MTRYLTFYSYTFNINLLTTTCYEQAFNVVENKDFREMLRFASFGHMLDSDIPHRQKLKELILRAYHTNHDKLKRELQVY